MDFTFIDANFKKLEDACIENQEKIIHAPYTIEELLELQERQSKLQNAVQWLANVKAFEEQKAKKESRILTNDNANGMKIVH